MRLAVRPVLHVVAKQDDFRRAPVIRQAERLITAIASGVNPLRVGRETRLVDRFDPVDDAVQRVCARPALARENLLALRAVLRPPAQVCRIQRIRPRRPKDRVVYYDDTSGFRGLPLPRLNDSDVVIGEAGAAGDTDDGCPGPSSSAFPASTRFTGTACAVRMRTSPARSRSRAVASSIHGTIGRPSMALICPCTKFVSGIASTSIETNLQKRGPPSRRANRGGSFYDAGRFVFLMNAAGR